MKEMEFNGDAETQAKRASRYTYIAAGLIALAFTAPFVMNWGSPYRFGQTLGQILGALLFMVFISWLITRNRSDLAKAKGRLAVAVLLCLSTAGNSLTAKREEDIAKDFMRGAVEFQEKNSVKFIDLGKRFETVTVHQYTTAEAIASPQAMEAAQLALERYRLLLQERSLLLQTYLADWRAFVNNVPHGEARRSAEQAMGPKMEQTQTLYRNLDVAQRVHVEALGAVFTWAQAQAGKLGVRDGQLVFQSAKQQQELQALAAKLQTAEDAAEKVEKVTQAEQVKAGERHQDALKNAEQFLSGK